jgi:hypothetical protein
VRLLLAVGCVAMNVTMWAAMPPGEQNALVKQYCTGCHTDSAMNGGLSLQSYNAAKRDPTLAAMILSKLNAGAMGAAGVGVPPKAAQDAWLASTKEQAVGAEEWFVSHEDGLASASIVREVPSRRPDVRENPIYRIKIVCNTVLDVGRIELTWSPQPQTGRAMTVVVDGDSAVEYRIDGRESMGNGATVQSGHASIVLTDNRKLRFPNHSLTIRELFDGETVEFPFSALDQKNRAELRSCF